MTELLVLPLVITLQITQQCQEMHRTRKGLLVGGALPWQASFRTVHFLAEPEVGRGKCSCLGTFLKFVWFMGIFYSVCFETGFHYELSM